MFIIFFVLYVLQQYLGNIVSWYVREDIICLQLKRKKKSESAKKDPNERKNNWRTVSGRQEEGLRTQAETMAL